MRDRRPRLARRTGTVVIVSGIVVALACLTTSQALAQAKRPRGTIAPGTIAGPIIGGIAANNGHYAYGPYTWAGALPQNPFLGPALPVAPGCYVQRQRIWTEYGWRWREAPICY